MGLIAKTKLKLLSGLTVVQRDCPINAHTVTRSTAHIKGSKTGVHTIPQAHVEDEGGDTKEEIDRFTSALETSARPSSSALARGPNRLNRLLARVDQMFTMLDSPYAAHRDPVCIRPGTDHCIVFTNRGLVHGARIRFRV